MPAPSDSAGPLDPAPEPFGPGPAEARAFDPPQGFPVVCSRSLQLSVITQRCGPVNPGTARGLIGDLAAATDLFSAVQHIAKAAAARIIDGHAASVVNDVESQHVGDIDFDGQS